MPKHTPRRTKNPNTAPAARPRTSTSRTWRELRIPLAPGDIAALAALRRLARGTLDAWSIEPEQSEDILVVLSELATNALVHTNGPARVRLVRRAGQVHLHVTDTDTTTLELEGGPEFEAERGYGLACVAVACADEVTVTAHRKCGKTVNALFTVRR